MRGICVRPPLGRDERLLALKRDAAECHFLVERGRAYRVVHRFQLFPFSLRRDLSSAPDDVPDRAGARAFFREASERYVGEDEAFPLFPPDVPRR